MTQGDMLYRFRLRTIALAEELGNVRAACRVMGIHPSTFYRWKNKVERFGCKLEAVMSDNGGEFRAKCFRSTVAELGAEHHFTRSGRPQTNGCVERFQGTVLEECWKPAFARSLVPKQTGLRRDVEQYVTYYNFDRAHTGRWTKGRTPAQAIGANNMYAGR